MNTTLTTVVWTVLQFSLAELFSPLPLFFSEFRRVGLAIGSSWLVCTLVCHGREGTRQPCFPFHLWTSVWVQRLLWVWSNRVSGQFFMSRPWVWAGGVTVAYEPGVFSTGSWLLSSSLMRFSHWGIGKALNLKTSLGKGGGRRDQQAEDAPGLCPAQLNC